MTDGISTYPTQQTQRRPARRLPHPERGAPARRRRPVALLLLLLLPLPARAPRPPGGALPPHGLALPLHGRGCCPFPRRGHAPPNLHLPLPLPADARALPLLHLHGPSRWVREWDDVIAGLNGERHSISYVLRTPTYTRVQGMEQRRWRRWRGDGARWADDRDVDGAGGDSGRVLAAGALGSVRVGAVPATGRCMHWSLFLLMLLMMNP